jgi:vancomycin resistance protein YoaR
MSSLRVEAGVSSYYARRRRQARIRMLKRAALAAMGLVVAGAFAVGMAFAGSTHQIASGVRIAGVDVGGLKPAEAEQLLRHRYAEFAKRPIVLTAGTRRFEANAGPLGIVPDWQAAIAAASKEGDGFGPIRGFRRLYVRFAGADVSATAAAYEPALNLFLARIAHGVDVPHQEAALRRSGLRVVVVPAHTGRVLDRAEAASRILAAFASFSRAPLVLPFRVDRPRVTTASIEHVAAQARVALSGPVRLALGKTRYLVSAWRIASILSFPKAGARALAVGGPGADAYFARLEKTVDTEARDARFEVLAGGKIHIVPSLDARKLDAAATAKNVLKAVLAKTPAKRLAPIVVASQPPERTTADARAMGITGVVSSYTTIYGGVPNRIHNVQLVAHLIDDHLIAPGAEFSFNRTTGERDASKGFLEAPVIINGELQTGLGGGVCQVSTTVFNAAYEAGLKITARTNHALYISHYPQGRDATVDYPDVDLRFVNDTKHWLLLRTFVSSDSLTVNLYGTAVDRKVETETAPLVVTGAAPVKRMADPSLYKGQQVVDESGSPSLSTSVHRKVYTETGKLLYDNVWYSSYRGEYRMIRYGTKPKPKPKPKPAKPAPVREPLPAGPAGLGALR